MNKEPGTYIKTLASTKSDTLSLLTSLNSFTISPNPKASKKPSSALIKDSDDDNTSDIIVVGHSLVPEIPDPSPGEIGPPPPLMRSKPYRRSISTSRSSGVITQPAAPTQNIVSTSRIARSQENSALVSIPIGDLDKPITFTEAQDSLGSNK